MSVQGAPAAGQAKSRVTVSRYSVFTRLNHWTLATCFVLLALTGLSLFHPSLFWIAGLFGGGAVVRWLHPWIGVVLIVAWLVMFVRFLRANLPERGDGEWLARSRDVLSGHEENLPEVGKYNAGQKLVFWTFSLLVPGLFLTGIAIWDQYFYDWTTILQKRVSGTGPRPVCDRHDHGVDRARLRRRLGARDHSGHDARLCHRRLGVAAPSQVAARARRRPSQERDTGKPRGVGLRAGGRCAAVSAGKVPRDRCGS